LNFCQKVQKGPEGIFQKGAPEKSLTQNKGFFLGIFRILGIIFLQGGFSKIFPQI
jgi:hypothetical protein